MRVAIVVAGHQTVAANHLLVHLAVQVQSLIGKTQVHPVRLEETLAHSYKAHSMLQKVSITLLRWKWQWPVSTWTSTVSVSMRATGVEGAVEGSTVTWGLVTSEGLSIAWAAFLDLEEEKKVLLLVVENIARGRCLRGGW